MKTMKILKTFKQMTIISFKFESNENGQNLTRIQWTWQMIFAIYAIFQGIFLSTIFLICTAQTFTDYSETFFPWGAVIIAFIRCILQIYINGEKNLQLIDRIEGVIDKRNNSSHINMTHQI